MLQVAGLSVFERLLKQEVRAGHQVLVLTDGSVPIPWSVASQVATVPLAGTSVDEQTAAHERAEILRANTVRPGGSFAPLPVTDEDSRQLAEKAVFDALLRDDLGWVARHLNKPLSFAVTRHVLCRSPLSPNQVTVGAGLVGLLGCWILAHGTPFLVMLGLLLVHLQSVLDGCDGELARVRFQQSALGEWLDTVVDDFLNLAILVSLGAAFYARAGLTVWALLPWVGAGMLVFYDAVAYRELIRQGEGGEVLKVRWWFAGGKSMKARVGSGGASFKDFALALGRRDVFLFSWFVLGLAGQLGVVALWAFLVALTYFVVALGQVLVPRSSPAAS